MPRFRLLALLSFCSIATGFSAEPGDKPISFVREIRPILADKCLHCHGPDEKQRQADLRLDQPEKWTGEREGSPIVAPGDPTRSELLRRVTANRPDERMPPPDEPRQLTAVEIEKLRRWIEQGASFEQHWSFQPLRRPSLPEVADKAWGRSPIDLFVLKRIEDQNKAAGNTNLAHSEQAERTSLIRRVTLDLTGIPPSPEDVEAYVRDPAPNAYERVVDRLLASPQYGERVALVWLDAARYADSGGYQGDILRSMWIWRDWLIAALNRNVSFDQFTIEQLAGDLLPGATQEQRIATGFHRNHRINDEDGIILEEFRVEYVADRVETTAGIWLGLTVGCARCHDHKYDPISQREYYSLFAYFNSIAEQGRGHGNAPPLISVPTESQQQKLNESAAAIAVAQQELDRLAADASVTAELRNEQKKKVDGLRAQHDALAKQVPTTMVLEELPQPRDTFVLVRGAYDKPAEKVAPGTPQAVALPGTEFLPNRMGLAQWLVDKRNPLTARVSVNRFWQMLFGRGLVETAEDFGTQGQLPTHPELLDWLASEFAGVHDSSANHLVGSPAWDMKQFLRLIVTSDTYRQTANVSAAAFERDPANEFLARGPRFRLPAELIRDQALAASGLLVHRVGGPSVRPYQPDGIWKELVSADPEYNQGHGADLYRRSLYTFVRRTVPPPAMIALDAPNREICTVRRQRTNTPLQALIVMNDPTFVEAARGLAERVLRESSGDDTSRLTYAVRLLLARSPSAVELNLLTESLHHFQKRFGEDLAAANQFIRIGESRPDERLDPKELAAYTAIANLLLNLDETLTK